MRLKENVVLSNDAIRAITATVRNYGRALDDDVLELWLDDLESYHSEQVIDACKRYRDNPKNEKAPTIGQIIGLIERKEEDGRPGAEEAWATIKPLLGNEDISAIVTQEMQGAYIAANNLGKDLIGARKAFIEVYEKLVKQSRDDSQPCIWLLWAGESKDLRTEAAIKGIKSGKLKPEQVKQWLPASTSKNIELADLARENINRAESGLPALSNTVKLEDQRTYAQRKIDEILERQRKVVEQIERPANKNAQSKFMRNEEMLRESKTSREKIILQCQRPQPPGTLAIGIDGKPQSVRGA